MCKVEARIQMFELEILHFLATGENDTALELTASIMYTPREICNVIFIFLILNWRGANLDPSDLGTHLLA